MRPSSIQIEPVGLFGSAVSEIFSLKDADMHTSINQSKAICIATPTNSGRRHLTRCHAIAGTTVRCPQYMSPVYECPEKMSKRKISRRLRKIEESPHYNYGEITFEVFHTYRRQRRLTIKNA